MGKSYLTNLIPFYDKVTHLVDQEKLGVVYFGFSKILIFSLQSLFILDEVFSTLLEKSIIH